MKKLLVMAALSLAVSAQAKESLAPPVEFVPGEFIVKLKNNKMLENVSAFSAFSNSENVRVVNKERGVIVVKRNILEKQTFSMNTLQSSDLVEYVEPNYIYNINNTPNDPMLGQLWGLINVAQPVGSLGAGRHGIDIDALRAWHITTGSKDIVIAVIDTGVDYTIPDLAENIWTNDAEINGEDGVDDDQNGYIDDKYGYDFANNRGDSRDDHGHGSHCAGTIGGKGDNATGVVGVNWNTRIMGVKFLTASGSGTLENAIKSIDYARINGANIMSNSWGGGGFSQALEDAIRSASDAGILFVAAAGNHKGNNDEAPTYPANYDVENVISVAAINNKGNLASFSCFGKEKVHLAAPGVEILSTTPAGFKSWSGTSMATPHVSGVAALVWGNTQDLSMTELKNRLIKTARPIAGLRNRVATGGIVNAYHALTNTTAPLDPMDPFHWLKVDESISTEHPYLESSDITWEISAAGADQLAVHFSMFDTEGGYDTVTFSDKSGKVIDVWSGNLGAGYSPAVDGDTIIIRFKSDKSMNKDGFDIDKVAVKGEIEDIKVIVRRL